MSKKWLATAFGIVVAAMAAVPVAAEEPSETTEPTGSFTRSCEGVLVTLRGFPAGGEKVNKIRYENNGTQGTNYTFTTAEHEVLVPWSPFGEVRPKVYVLDPDTDKILHHIYGPGVMPEPAGCGSPGEVELSRDCANLVISYRDIPPDRSYDALIVVWLNGNTYMPDKHFQVRGTGTVTLPVAVDVRDFRVMWHAREISKTLDRPADCDSAAKPAPTTTAVAVKGSKSTAQLPATGPDAQLLLIASLSLLVVGGLTVQFARR